MTETANGSTIEPKVVYRRHSRRCPFYRSEGYPCVVARMFSDADTCPKRPCMVHQQHAYTSRKYARAVTNTPTVKNGGTNQEVSP